MSNDLMTTLVPALGSLLIAAVSWAALKLADFIKARTHNEYLKGVLVRADDAVATAVKSVMQTYVDEVREHGSDADGLTDADKKHALDMALAKAKEYLGPKGLALIAQVLGLGGPALDSFLIGKIEAAVRDTKANEALLAPPPVSDPTTPGTPSGP